MPNNKWAHQNKDNAYNSELDEFFIHEGIPVLVHSCGQYPVLVNEHGESTRDIPHFTITYAGAYGKTTTYREIQLTGHAGLRRGCKQSLTLWSLELDNVSDIAPFIEQAKHHVDVGFLKRIPAKYDAAEQRIAMGNDYPEYLHRSEYEKACKVLGVECYPDEGCTPWGSFSYPQYSADAVLAHHLSLKRYRQINAEQKQQAEQAAKAQPLRPDPVPKQTGQLWEPCERCGNEPVYMPLQLCNDCWPTS